MKFRHFVKSLLKVTFAMAVVLFALGFFKFYLPYIIISWVSLAFFLGLTMFSGYYNTRSVRKPFFINIFFGTMAVKFMFSGIFIFTYFLLIEPDKWVILPMMAIFFAYKAAETLLLVKAFRESEGVV